MLLNINVFIITFVAYRPLIKNILTTRVDVMTSCTDPLRAKPLHKGRVCRQAGGWEFRV